MSNTRRHNPLPWILGLSAAVTAFLVWWIYFKTTGETTGAAGAGWIASLPAVNATFNTLCAVCLMTGYWHIRAGRRTAHQRFMVAGVVFSALFLVSYLTYHHFQGDTPFPGEGVIRPIYFAILISHIVLSVVMLPMILGTLYHASRGHFASHRKIARWTLPVWLYVSITGVVIFFLLEAHKG